MCRIAPASCRWIYRAEGLNAAEPLAKQISIARVKPMHLVRSCSIAALLAASVAAPAFAAASPLVPHRAVYDLELDQASDRSGVNSITGRMVYEFDGSPCDGYTVTFRFVSQIDTDDVSRVTDQQTTTYEAGDGSSFNFSTRSFVDSSLDRELRGSAALDDEGISVRLTQPEASELELEASRFPTQHLLDLISRVVGGERFYETTIFDGSDGADKVMTTTVIIGNEGTTEQNDPEREALGDMAQDRFWPVDMAYFDMSTTQGEELPTYRISFKLYENGVSSDMIMDYGDFSMAATLVDLAMFDVPQDCPQ
jgi:hypothetical protein